MKLVKRFKMPFFCIAMATLLIFTGCSSSSPTSSATESNPEVSFDANEIYEDVLAYAEDNNMQTSGDDADTRIREEIDASIAEGSGDAYSIFTALCEAGVFVDAPTEGIMVMTYEQGEDIEYTSTGTYKCTTFTVKLDLIDPETGDVANYRTFSSEETNSCSSSKKVVSNTTDFSGCFNEDLTRMVATLTLEDGSFHVGWIDETGEFTDVSAQITTASDFGNLVQHSVPFFASDNYFYFTDRTDGDAVIKRVPLDNLSEDAVETLGEDNAYYTYPNGTMRSLQGYPTYYYYDSSMTYGAESAFFYDWVSANQFVGLNLGQNLITSIKADKDYSAYGNYEVIYEGVTNRNYWYPVASPQGDQIAFLSQRTSGSDRTVYLYTAPLNGESDPVAVETDYTFVGGANTTDIYTTCLVDWL